MNIHRNLRDSLVIIVLACSPVIIFSLWFWAPPAAAYEIVNGMGNNAHGAFVFFFTCLQVPFWITGVALLMVTWLGEQARSQPKKIASGK